jgi:gluconolactonase
VKHNSALTLFHAPFESQINVEFEITLLDGTCSFSEGPAWSKDGFYLFSDIPENVICSIAPRMQKRVHLERSGCTLQEKSFLSEQTGSNGLAFNREGQLYICQHGNGSVGVLRNGEIEPMIAEFRGRRFNSPNDLVLHPEGAVFFTDPPYGLKDSQLAPDLGQPKAGLYRFKEGRVDLISDIFKYPNGVCLSPDGSVLYCCSNKPAEKFILIFNALTGESLGSLCEENSDGIKCDRWGNLWLCTKEGIVVIDNKGVRVAKIELPTVPANCCWGGKDGSDLLITARKNIFHIQGILK